MIAYERDSSRRSSSKLVELIVMGSGGSAAVPDITCVTDVEHGCEGCLRSRRLVETSDKSSERNTRGNTGAVVRIPQADGSHRVILIDCGKARETDAAYGPALTDSQQTFREQALKLFRKHGLRRIDAVLITRAVQSLSRCRG